MFCRFSLYHISCRVRSCMWSGFAPSVTSKALSPNASSTVCSTTPDARMWSSKVRQCMYLVRNLSGLNTAVMTCSGSAMGLTWGDMCDVFIAFNSCLSAKMADITCPTAHPARWGELRSPGSRTGGRDRPGGLSYLELQMDAAEDVDDILGQAFHHFAYGLARGRRIAGYVLPSGRAEEHEEIAGRECGGAGGIGWNCHDERRRWICCCSGKRCGCHVISCHCTTTARPQPP